MSAILCVNAGSSSLRLAIYRPASPAQGAAADRAGGGVALTRARGARFALDRPVADLLREFAAGLKADEIRAVAHRIVHGGPSLTQARIIDAAAEAALQQAAVIAPLHVPRQIALIDACREIWDPQLPQVAVPDTAYYSDLPATASTYALPRELAERHGLRRFGFHGLAHQAMVSRWQALHPGRAADSRLISLQLGAGCSVTASRAGRAVDTSMGFSPLEGLIMATRCGDIDPGLLLHLQRVAGLTTDALDHLLNDESGLLGLSGISGEMQILLASEDPRARLAIDVYCYRARRYIGAYLAVLGGADAVLFGGGVGEHSPEIRAAILRDLEWVGIEVDPAANQAAWGAEARISTDASRMAAWAIPVDEAHVLAETALALLTAK